MKMHGKKSKAKLTKAPESIAAYIWYAGTWECR